MKLERAIDIIEKIAPPECGADWDNSGIQINTGASEIEKIMFCLEINDAVIDEAIEASVDLIVTHHPLLFHPPKQVDIDKTVGRYIIKLVHAGICVYSAHITFDNAPLGNNFYLATLLGLEDVTEIDGEVGVMGDLPQVMKLSDVKTMVEKVLDMKPNRIRVAGDENLKVARIALCTGAGDDLINASILNKDDCQLLLTGDVKLHNAQEAKARGVAIIDAGHYDTEKIFSENFAKQFRDFIEETGEKAELLIAKANTDPFL